MGIRLWGKIAGQWEYGYVKTFIAIFPWPSAFLLLSNVKIAGQ
jgi:hypothetical protein